MSTVQLKRSATASKVPLVADLQLGEIALNTYDGRLFFKKDPGTAAIVTVATTDDTQTLTNKTLSSSVISGTLTANGSVGTAGQVLTSNASGVYWSTVSGGGGGGGANLTLSSNGSTVSINSDSGTDVVILAANSTTAGVLTAEAQTIGGVKTFSSNVTISSAITANGSVGTAGQVLSSNATGVYWATVSGGGASSTSLPIENSAGSVEFTSTDTTGLQFAAGGIATVAFDAANYRVTFTATEADTLSSVTGRGASTSTQVVLNGGITTTTTTALTLDSGTTGAINIGTNAFARTITVGNATGASALTLDSGTGAINIGTSIAKTITIGNSTGATALALNSGTGNIVLTATTGSVQLVATGANIITATTNGTERMRIDGAGNVGIGTTAPAACLHVFSSNLSNQFRIQNVTTDATTKYGAVGGGHYTNAEEPLSGMLMTSAASSNRVDIGGGVSAMNAATLIVFSTAANTTTLTGTERMRIDATGNVGIGTNAPLSRLDIYGSTASSGLNAQILNVTDTGGDNTRYAGLNLVVGSDASTGSIRLFRTNSASDFSNAMTFWTKGSGAGATSPTERMRIDSVGNVGIGTVTPGTKLDVVGSITSRAAATQDGVILAGRSGGTSTYAVTITPATLSANRTVTLPDGNVTLQFGTMATTGGTLAQFAATTSAELRGVISDETGGGLLVFATSPTFTTTIDGGATFGAFASSTALTLGYTGTAASTTNISTGAVATGTTKTINIGTGAAAGSTTNINIGSAIGGTTTVNNSLTVTGNLTVSGTTTTFNSTTVTIDDPIFTLGGDTAPGSDDNKDRGIEFRWHNGSAAKLGFFGFDDSTGYFTFIPDATNTSDVFSGTKGTLDVTAITGSAASWTTARTITLAGDLTGNVSIDGSAGVTLTATIAADSVALGTDTTGNYVASITNGSYITGGNGGSEGAALTLAVDATTTNTASKVVARDASGDFAAGTITAAAVKVDTTYNLDSATATVASLTQTAIASFSSTTFGGGKVTIQAFDSVTGARTMCELLIVHNGTTASATEYGIVNTGASSIATYDVDINTGNVRILATGATTNSTQYKVVQTLILA